MPPILVVLSVVAGVAGAWVGHTLARNHYEPLLASTNKQIGTLTTANTNMKGLVEKQSSAIADMKSEADRREREATQAVQQARQQSAKEHARAQSVLLLRPPTGVNPCVAAQVAFDDELRMERGGK